MLESDEYCTIFHLIIFPLHCRQSSTYDEILMYFYFYFFIHENEESKEETFMGKKMMRVCSTETSDN